MREYKPGSLVQIRNRPWIILPSEDKDLLLVKPLNGTDEEITGIYLPLAHASDKPQDFHFRKPDVNDLGNDFPSARLLYNASRLSFRSASGPFRCLGKLSFRPRSYQMVPLIMGLRQETVRMLIADDVGIGKTIEALLIAKELYERKEIRQFAILCLPHLCDQWQEELKSKFGIEAVIIRSGTVTSLERQLRSNEAFFKAFPFQIISIDYIKQGSKCQTFLTQCPEFVIVDEAHTCAKPSGAYVSQQLRHNLLHNLAANEKRHLVLLTATPHSGKEAEFKSLLGLLKPNFEQINISQSQQSERKELAQHFIQRRRADVVKWLGEDTPFPDRLFEEKAFNIGTAYVELFNEVLSYAQELVRSDEGDRRTHRYNYWDALALLRGVMSSPAAGAMMLTNKANKKRPEAGVDEEATETISDEAEAAEQDTVLDPVDNTDDSLPLSVLGRGRSFKTDESKWLLKRAQQLAEIGNIQTDLKAKAALDEAKKLLAEGYHPIIFCRYIQTARYLGDLLKHELRGRTYSGLQIETVTSELNDEQRRETIQSMHGSPRRLLVATDCLSEGINLQEDFNAVIHYDLPWNPNRLEQREGRIDRFGQQSPQVKVILMYGANNPIDGVVLDVLLRKAREIRKALGISVPFPENSESVIMAVTNAVLLKPNAALIAASKQLSLFDDEIRAKQLHVSQLMNEAAEREKETRSIFAQNRIKPEEIEHDLQEIDEAIGNVKAVEDFVTDALRHLGVQVDQKMEGYRILMANVPPRLKSILTDKGEIQVSFQSPTPHGFHYIGRNHPFTEHLSQYVLHEALEQKPGCAARAAVIRTKSVTEKTVVFQFRVRNVIAEQTSQKQIVTEEMWLWGYRGNIQDGNRLDKSEAMELLLGASGAQNLSIQEQQQWLMDELQWINDENYFRKITDPVAITRAENLVKSHTRFRKLVSGTKYKVVEPVLPMDVLGMYVILPSVT